MTSPRCCEPSSRVYLTVLMAMSLLIAAMVYVLHEGNQISQQYHPLLHATTAIEEDLARSCVGLGGLSVGQGQETLVANVLGHLADADQSAQMLAQSVDQIGAGVLSSGHQGLEGAIGQLRQELSNFGSTLAAQQDPAQKLASDSSQFTPKLERLFECSNAIETEIGQIIAGDLKVIVALQTVLILTSLMLTFAIVSAFRRYDRARRRAEEELARSRCDAENANQCKSDFLANMSHEMRTPLTAILGYADLLAEEPDAVDACVAAEIIRRNGAHLLDLINDILDLSKIEAGKYETKLDACSPVELVAEVVALLRIRAEAKGLTLQAQYEGPIPETVTTDATRLRQILLNVVGNAVKFTELGEIHIVTRLNQNDGEARLEFDVVDTGIGMSGEELERLFSPFTQGQRKLGGTGLGLAISRRLARILGGDIQVTSQLGQGSTFRITVAAGDLSGTPIVEHVDVPKPANGKRHGQGEGTSPRLPCRILLAEDGPDNQRFISLILRMAGADVTVADNGQMAVELALKAEDENASFDLVIMDMQMPVMDGYEATHRLREVGFTRPIIALTAYAMKDDMAKCLAAGCDAYASKPVDRERLLAMLHSHMTGTALATKAAPATDQAASR
ncbi:MAG: ATP-binding protein [Thermoguttaceae bacterium]